MADLVQDGSGAISEGQVMKRELLSVAIGAAASLLVASSAVAGTLDDVKKKGFLQCGVSQGLIGFSNADDAEQLDRPRRRLLPRRRRGDLRRRHQGQVHAPARPRSASPRCSRARSTCCRATRPGPSPATPTSAWSSSPSSTMTARASWCRKELGVDSAQGARSGATVCVQTGTTTELNLADYFRANNMSYEVGGLRERRRGARRL